MGLSFDLEAKLTDTVGMELVKDELRQMYLLHQVNIVRKSRGLRESRKFAPHIIFMGNPGVGKTRAGRLIGELLRATGVLDAADCATEECYAEWTKVDMVTSYKGQTAPKVREMINDMRGGVVLIDEAYTLTDRKAGSKEGGHGIEAYDTVMNALNSQDPVFVFAGYEDKMQKFMVANPGLPRRVLRRFKLPNLILLSLLRCL